MITKEQAEEIVKDLGYSLNPIQFFAQRIDATALSGFLYIGYVNTSQTGNYIIRTLLNGNETSEFGCSLFFAGGDSMSTPQQFCVFDEIALISEVNFIGYRMKI